MKKNWLLLLVLSCLLQSCLISLHPLYTPDTLVYKPELLGTWKDSEGLKWTFEPSGEDSVKTYYHLSLQKKGKKKYYTAHLVTLNENMYLDVLPKANKKSNSYELMGELAYFVPTHNFIRLTTTGNSITVSLFSTDYLDQLYKDGKTNLGREKLENNDYLINASTAELQAFFKKFGGIKEAFQDPTTMVKQ
jgi:hypothetical protein